MSTKHSTGGPTLRFLERITRMPYSALFSVWLLVMFVFAIAYFALSTMWPEHGVTHLAAMETVRRLGNSLYFSVMTSTTVGYGDLTPLGFAKVLASIEGALGFFVFAVFITKVVSYRSDIAMQEVHSLMFENKFHHAREGLFTIRKDFDTIIHEATSRRTLTEDAWDRLAIAYWEGQRILEGMIRFYDDDYHLYTIDEKRERLLLEATHRTLDRLLAMFDALDESRIDWKSHGKNREELQEFLRAARTTINAWKKKSPHTNSDWFRKLYKSVELLTAKVPTT